MKLLFLMLLLTACGSNYNANRDLCVENAAAEYYDGLDVCIEKNIDYDQCIKDNDLENKFQEKQIECRSVE